MAWCPHCKEDRQIQRQTFKGKCEFCGRIAASEHQDNCRGPLAGTLDVCTYCNTPLFAKVNNQEEYNLLLNVESQIKKGGCFVITASMGDDQHHVVNEMRSFRDIFLSDLGIGRRFVKWYYKNGPHYADIISCNKLLRILSFMFIVIPSFCISKVVLSLKK